jgi:hypothetical protein
MPPEAITTPVYAPRQLSSLVSMVAAFDHNLASISPHCYRFAAKCLRDCVVGSAVVLVQFNHYAGIKILLHNGPDSLPTSQ